MMNNTEILNDPLMLDESQMIKQPTQLEFVLDNVNCYSSKPYHNIYILKDTLIAQNDKNRYFSLERSYNPEELKDAILLENVFSLPNCIEAFPNESRYTYRNLVFYYFRNTNE